VLETELVPQIVLVHPDIMKLDLHTVQFVLLNVLLVKIVLITVFFVPKEELTHQNVSVLTDNSLMVLNVLLVLSNVKLVPLTKPVSSVLMIPELMLQFVNVEKDIMKMVLPNVQFVLNNV